MRRIVVITSLLIVSACVESCSIAKALYIAIVHNSGAPSRDERRRIDAREQEFLRGLPTSRVAILPVAILGRDVRHDAALSASIASLLRERDVTMAEPNARVTALPFEPQPNELAIFWSRFTALASAYDARPQAGVDYVMQVDVIGAPEDGRVVAVHVMTTTADGRMAYHAIWNSHQSLYKEILPRSDADVARLVVTALARATPRP